MAAAETPLLAGTLPLDEGLSARWPWSGAWTWPVGDPCVLCGPGTGDGPGWRLLRGFATRPERHHGADFGDGRAHDPVRAAAHGLVVLARDRDDGGFGTLVVLAHRLREGGIAFSVYSHLARGSVLVREGGRVAAGETIAGVGRTGNATADHLHFEVRVAADPSARWERARAVDPVLFVRRRLPRFAADTSLVAGALDWADRAGLVPTGVGPGAPLTRETWHHMLSRAARVPVLEPPRGARALREWLVGRGVLPEDDREPLSDPPDWSDLERDFARLASLGTRLPPAPAASPVAALPPPERPAAPPAPGATPTLADACLRLAALAGDASAEPALP